MTEEKPFEATRRRLRDARKRGEVLRAPLAVFAIQLISLTIVLCATLRSIWLRFQILLEYSLVWGFSNPALCLREGGIFIVELVFPALGVSASACVLMELWQVGPGWYPGAGAGVSVVSGTRKVVKGLCSIHVVACKTLGIFAICLYCMSRTFHSVMFVPARGGTEVLQLFPQLVREVWLPVFLSVISFGAIEYFMKRRQFRAEVSMSFDELRQELKEEEGDPHIRAARQQLHRALAYEELASRVRNSKVLIVERA